MPDDKTPPETEDAPETAPEKKPPWESDDKFDPERAWKLILDLRSDLDKVKTDRDGLKTQVQEHEDASKSDNQKLEERSTNAEKRATAAEAEASRLRVALRKGLSETQAKRLVGDSEDDLEKDADELLASFRSDDDPDDGEQPPRRPRERLRPGAAPGAEPEKSDPAALAEDVPRGW